MTEKYIKCASVLEKINEINRLVIEQSVNCKAQTALLPVPYISQLGEGADLYNNDCGAAAGAMLIEAYGEGNISVNKFYEETGQNSDMYLSATQIMRVLRQYGVSCTWQEDLSIEDLFCHLRFNTPLIVLINYGIIRGAIETESNFTGPHFSTVVGLNISEVYIHDPLWSDEGGKALAIPINVFAEAWMDVPYNDDVSFGAIVPSVSIGDDQPVYKARVTAHVLNVRQGPGINHSINGDGLLNGEIVSVLEVSGDWGRIGPQRWIHLGYTERV